MALRVMRMRRVIKMMKYIYIYNLNGNEEDEAQGDKCKLR